MKELLVVMGNCEVVVDTFQLEACSLGRHQTPLMA